MLSLITLSFSQTWCILSAKSGKEDCLENLKIVISDISSSYARDLSLLLELSMTVKLDDYAVDVCDEILSNFLNGKKMNLQQVVQNLHSITRGNIILELNKKGSQTRMLHRIFKIWSNLFEIDIQGEPIVHLPNELNTLFQDCASSESTANDFLHIISNEIAPRVAIDAYQLILSSSKAQNMKLTRNIFSPLRRVMERSISEKKYQNENSLILFKIESLRANQNLKNVNSVSRDAEKAQDTNEDYLLWDRIGQGIISVQK